MGPIFHFHVAPFFNMEGCEVYNFTTVELTSHWPVCPLGHPVPYRAIDVAAREKGGSSSRTAVGTLLVCDVFVRVSPYVTFFTLPETIMEVEYSLFISVHRGIQSSKGSCSTSMFVGWKVYNLPGIFCSGD